MQQAEIATARELVGRDGPFRLSLVVPVFNEETTLDSLFDRVLPILEQTTPDYEVVCVNDGSSDRSLAALARARQGRTCIKIVDLSRNFGKEAALTAGLEYASGDAVIPLDADLQDPPELIPQLVAKWREGYDTVVAVRENRRSDSFARRTSANLFYRVLARTSEVPIPSNAGDFRLLDRRVVEVLKQMPERSRFMKGLFAWLGFRQASISYVRPSRVAGKSKWRYWQLWNFALDGIFSFSTMPLRIWTYFGLLASIVAFCYMFWILAQTLIYGVQVPGYASIVVLLLFFSGVNMIGLGIIGEYLGRVFIEVKRRPIYLVRDAVGFDHQSQLEHAQAESHKPGGRGRARMKVGWATLASGSPNDSV
jgi:polyisoprenyl-phosphate glycosyltransferase